MTNTNGREPSLPINSWNDPRIAWGVPRKFTLLIVAPKTLWNETLILLQGSEVVLVKSVSEFAEGSDLAVEYQRRAYIRIIELGEFQEQIRNPPDEAVYCVDATIQIFKPHDLKSTLDKLPSAGVLNWQVRLDTMLEMVE